MFKHFKLHVSCVLLSCYWDCVAQNRDNIIKHSIKSLQLLYHANLCNHVLQVLPTTSLVYIVFPYSGPGISQLFKFQIWKHKACALFDILNALAILQHKYCTFHPHMYSNANTTYRRPTDCKLLLCTCAVLTSNIMGLREHIWC